MRRLTLLRLAWGAAGDNRHAGRDPQVQDAEGGVRLHVGRAPSRLLRRSCHCPGAQGADARLAAACQRPGSFWTDVVHYQRHGILDSSVLEETQEEQLDSGRQPVLMILGGGMAAGKSTVREIIGQSDFWSKVGAT